ncbi:MAG: DUF3450 domain-containing protein [Arcobacteraceae bacterium]
MKSMLKAFSIVVLFQTLLFSNQIDQSIDTIEKTNVKLNSVQQKIDKEDEVKNVLLEEYKYTNKELQNTIKYNAQLTELINSQNAELKDIDRQLVEIEQTHKNIYPLMADMITSLQKLIVADTPFLLEERTKRVERLEKNLNRADIKTAEKFRIILEAFKIEYDYANSIEAYESEIEGKTYNMLRIGRAGLYYQSLDFKSYGYWDNTNKKWLEVTDGTAQSNIRTAVKIAKKQQNVELLELPFLTVKGN